MHDAAYIGRSRRGKHDQENRGKTGNKGTFGEPRFCCGRGGHGDKFHRGQCDRECEGLPYRGQQRDGAENHRLKGNPKAYGKGCFAWSFFAQGMGAYLL